MITAVPTAAPEAEYTVTRMGDTVVIRQVDPGASTVTFSRPAAWDWARRLAAPVTEGRRKHPQLVVHYLDIDLNRSVIPADKVALTPEERAARQSAPSAKPAAPVRRQGPARERPPVASPNNYGLHETQPDERREFTVSTFPKELGLDRTAPTQFPPTERAVAFLNSLLAERFNEAVDPDIVADALNRKVLSRANVSRLIDLWKACPARNQPEAPRTAPDPATVDLHPMPKVDAGHYALRGGDNVVRFYKVDVPTKGQWAGRTFLSAQASDEYHRIRDIDTRRAVLTDIAADPIAALKLYGQELGQCGHCHRTLTDEESRSFGIGPTCRKHLGLL